MCYKTVTTNNLKPHSTRVFGASTMYNLERPASSNVAVMWYLERWQTRASCRSVSNHSVYDGCEFQYYSAIRCNIHNNQRITFLIRQ